MANATSVSGSGDLANITFEVIGAPPAATALTIDSAQLNDGAIGVELSHGIFAVNGLFSVSGQVDYYSGGPVPGVDLSMVGVGVHNTVTGPDGAFVLNDIPTGTFTLTPSKSDEVREITAFDASLVLQDAAGLIDLSPNQVLAADVNRNGSVAALDASDILAASVGLQPVPFQGAGRVWDFVPQDRGYALLNDDQTGQDFTALLIGDVSGSWSTDADPPPAPAALSTSSESAQLALAEIRARRGETVVLPLSIERNGADVLALDLELTYDPAVLSFRQAVLGAAGSDMNTAINPNQAGTIRAGLAGVTPLAQDGSLIEFTFEVVTDLVGESPITIDTAEINEGAIAVSRVHGSVVELLPGDIDADGEIGAQDIVALYANLGGTPNLSTDLNNDGEVNQQDVAILVHDILDTEFGDVNLDRKIDNTDFGFILGNFEAQGVGWDAGDMNGDGRVNNTDFGFVLGNFGFSNAASVAADVVFQRLGTVQVYRQNATSDDATSHHSDSFTGNHIMHQASPEGFQRHRLKKSWRRDDFTSSPTRVPLDAATVDAAFETAIPWGGSESARI